VNVWEEERKHFPLTNGDSFYLDHSTTGMIPDYSLKVMEEQLEKRFREGMDIDEYHIGKWGYMDALRDKIGQMFNCKGHQVCYGMSSTQLMNILGSGLDFHPGDNVVTTDTGYQGDNFVWLNMADRGVETRFAKTKRGYISNEDLMSYCDEHTRIVCLTIVDNKHGIHFDLDGIGKLCHEKGILLAVDATQGANVFDIDIKRQHISFLASSGYKWFMCPVGIGFACIDEDLLPKLYQSQCGWVGYVNRRKVNNMVLDLTPDARRFEYGGVNFLGFYALGESVERNLRLGSKNIEEYVMSMVDMVYARAPKELKRFKLYNESLPRINRAQVIALVVPEDMMGKVTTKTMREKGLICRVFDDGILRIGFHYMNTPGDVDKLFDTLKRIETEL